MPRVAGWVVTSAKPLIAALEGGGTDATSTAEARVPPPAGETPADVKAISRMRDAATWMATALGAVATAMVAGTQLSSIGALDFPEPRLLAAIASVVVGVVFTVLAIWAFVRAQDPVEVDLTDLRAMADTDGDPVAAAVAADTGYHRGTNSLAGLLAAYEQARADGYATAAQIRSLRLQCVGASGQDLQRHERELQSATERLAEQEKTLQFYRPGVVDATQLAVFRRFRRQFRVWVGVASALSLVAAAGFVGTAWAANPAVPDPAAAPVAAREPVAVTVMLVGDDLDGVEAMWGSDCAAASRDGGIPAIATASGDDGTTVMPVPSTDCPDPRPVVLAPDDAVVQAGPVEVAG